MESRARLLGHPIHQMLIVFPLGMLGAAVAFDVLGLVVGEPFWARMAYYLYAGGVLMGLLAAPFGLIDWLAIPSGTRAKSIGLIHALSNVAGLALFALSFWLRRPAPETPSTTALLLSFVAFAVAGVAAWFGGELVDRLGIGVTPGANPDAPSSLSRHTISDIR
jgi:uncharacterized membrane protein